jgi:hypothetical protein
VWQGITLASVLAAMVAALAMYSSCLADGCRRHGSSPRAFSPIPASMQNHSGVRALARKVPHIGVEDLLLMEQREAACDRELV